MPDLYKVSGVARTANQDEIKRAYRCLAKEFHPDLHPDRPRSRPSSRTSRAAYHMLSDPNRRAKYDRGEIDASGAEGPERTFYRHFADHDGGGAFFDQLSTIFGDSSWAPR